MDIFCEQIIKRKFGGKEAGIMLLTLVGAIAILMLTMMVSVLMYFLVFIIAGVLVGMYYIITNFDWEFEYSVTNGDFTCDKIIHRRKRKSIFSIDLHDTEEIGKYSPEKFEGKQFDYTFQVGKTAKGTDGEWYLTGRYDRYGKILIVFSPSNRVLQAIKLNLKRTVDTSALPAPEKEK
ncbi:MAG: hypothetical protein LKE53_07190 [Oscillospiraceae bacterium]|nr:hypothetical protein [Oscillospiraceae bacterium]MDD3260515.1 hypothetical protein [Oscillospiraceae bacterium]